MFVLTKGLRWHLMHNHDKTRCHLRWMTGILVRLGWPASCDYILLVEIASYLAVHGAREVGEWQFVGLRCRDGADSEVRTEMVGTEPFCFRFCIEGSSGSSVAIKTHNTLLLHNEPTWANSDASVSLREGQICFTMHC